MKQTIDILKHAPAEIVLMDALGELGNAAIEEIVDKSSADGNPGKVEVEVFVNGKPVPFIGALDAAIKHIFDNIDRHIAEEAKKLITEHPLLNSLLSTLDHADWKIKDIVEKLQKEQT